MICICSPQCVNSYWENIQRWTAVGTPDHSENDAAIDQPTSSPHSNTGTCTYDMAW